MAKAQERRLNAKQVFQLATLVQAEYTSSGLSDVAFAELASERLETAVSESSVATARKTFDIPAMRELRDEANRRNSDEGLVLRIEALEMTLAGQRDTTRLLAEAVEDQRKAIESLQAANKLLIAFAQKVGPAGTLDGLKFRIGG